MIRAFPVNGIANQNFTIARVDQSAPETSGRRGGVQLGWPVWQASWTLGNMTVETSDEWEALVSSLRGGQRIAFARDVRRPYPRRHAKGFRNMLTVGGDPFLGAATGWSDSIDDDGDCLLTLTGVPSGLMLSRIDYIGFKWESVEGAGYDRFALVRASAPAMADASGSITVTVEPPVPGVVPPSAVAYLDKPGCMMKLTGETALADADRLMKVRGSKIAAVQVLEP